MNSRLVHDWVKWPSILAGREHEVNEMNEYQFPRTDPFMNVVKTLKLIVVVSASLFAALTVQGQGAFKNLNFEQANPVIDPGGQFSGDVTAASALPGWTVYLGDAQQTDILQNLATTGEASVDIFGPNYPAAGVTPGFAPGTIDGNYSVLLQGGGAPPPVTELVSASIAQYGRVPPLAQSLEFKAWQTYDALFTVSFDGNILSPVVLGSGVNYTLYGVSAIRSSRRLMVVNW
jgi:hypothetical protein